MKIKKHIAISDSGVIYNGATGDSYSMNPIAGEIINSIKEGKSREEIKDYIMGIYEVSADLVDADLYDFYTHLRQLNFLESDE